MYALLHGAPTLWLYLSSCILYPKPLGEVLCRSLEDGEVVEGHEDTLSTITSVNESLLQNGFVRLHSTKSLKRIVNSIQKQIMFTSKRSMMMEGMISSLMERLERVEEEARDGHMRIWRYGDPGGDSDDDNVGDRDGRS